jgi:hypothetical protein
MAPVIFSQNPVELYQYINNNIFGKGKLSLTPINSGFDSRDENWAPCKYAQMTLWTLLYGSRTLCGVVACNGNDFR